MADDTNNPTQAPDPISSFRTQYPGTNLDDSEIYGHLSDPAKFRQVWPGTSLSDDDIRTSMQKYGIRRPDLQAPPGVPISKPTPQSVPESTSEQNISNALGPASGHDTSTMGAIGEGIKATTSSPLDTIRNAVTDAAKGAENPNNSSRGISGAVEHLSKVPGRITSSLKSLIVPPPNEPNQPQVPRLPQAIGRMFGLGLGMAAGGGDVPNDAMPNTALDASAAAQEIHNAVNPKIRFRNQGAGADLADYPDTEYQANVQRQLPRIAQFARETNLQVNDKTSLSQAAEGAHRAQNLHFQENILKPNANVPVRVTDIPGYGGDTLTPGVATIQQLYKRLGDVNAELDPRYRKAGGGVQASQTAVRSAAEANAEASVIRDTLYKKLGAATGQTPEQVAEANQAIGQLRSIAETTRQEAAITQSRTNDLQNSKWGSTSGEGLQKEAVARLSQRLQPDPSDTRIANVFNRLRVPSYSHVPVQAPVGATSPNATGLSNVPPTATPVGAVSPIGPGYGKVSNPAASLGELARPNPASNLGNVPNRFNSADSLGSIGRNVAPPSPGLYQGPQFVPSPIAEALKSIPTTQPTGQSLTEPPFSYPYERGQELGDSSMRKGNTAGEKAAMNRFYSENPSALGNIPAPIKQALKARVAAAEAPKPQADPEIEQLREKLKNLENPTKTASNPARDTATLKQVQTEHPEWTLSQQLQEAAKRVNPKGTK